MIRDHFITLELSETDTALLLDLLERFTRAHGNFGAAVLKTRLNREIDKTLQVRKDAEAAA